MGRIIAVASSGAGVGKTTTVAAVSASLASFDYKVLCIDFDAGSANGLESTLFLENNDAEKYLDDPYKHNDLIDACRKHPDIPNLYFLSVRMNSESPESDISSVLPMYAGLRDKFDFCIIDTPSEIGAAFRLAHIDADISIIITTEDLPAIRAANHTASEVLDIGVSDLRLLINRIQSKTYKAQHTPIDDLIEALGLQLIGLIHDDKYVSRALRKRIPLTLYKKKLAAHDFRDTAHRLSGNPIPWRVPPNHPYITSSAASKLPKGFIAAHGDPELWAKSTLPQEDADDLAILFTVNKSTLIGNQPIRYRMWLHDVLDDNGIRYQIEHKGGDEQVIYVRNANKERALSLMTAYESSAGVAQELTKEYDMSPHMLNGIAQINCPSCNELIDFDHHKCPYCKSKI